MSAIYLKKSGESELTSEKLASSNIAKLGTHILITRPYYQHINYDKRVRNRYSFKPEVLTLKRCLNPKFLYIVPFCNAKDSEATVSDTEATVSGTDKIVTYP